MDLLLKQNYMFSFIYIKYYIKKAKYKNKKIFYSKKNKKIRIKNFIFSWKYTNS